MKSTDQHSALVSQEVSLIPSSNLIDGRTERDRLSFLTEFASLINFYNNDNKIHGNWAPFLLKDPVFLLAQISATRFADIHNNYKNICHKLEQILIYKNGEGDLTFSMNQLFDQVTNLFMRIEQWTYHMQNSSESYDLKEYVINQVRIKYSAVFWAILSLQENLLYTNTIPNINPVKYYLFESYDEVIWKQSRGLTPFWDVLNIPVVINDATRNPKIGPGECYAAIKKEANELFNFFYTTIQYAGPEFEIQKIKTSQYPDTILLRTFVNLLGIHQKQLNGVGNRHLKFYFEDILKQQKHPAKADSVFVCAELSKPTATFNLPSGTLFNAGLDVQKNPILFSTTQNIKLNPATISNVYTLSQIPIGNKRYALCKAEIPNTGIVNKDPIGNVVGWETFGDSSNQSSVKSKLGFGFASPLLLLREGCRKIVIGLSYDLSNGSPISKEILSKASFFLSTQQGWLSLSTTKPIHSDCSKGKTLYEVDVNSQIKIDVEAELVIDTEIDIQTSTGVDVEIDAALKIDVNAEVDVQQNNPILIIINLDTTHPAIEAFKINPDGLNSEWPMFKVEFPWLNDLDKPPLLTSISIDVSATGVKNLQLYNDYGALSTKTPYQLFGPMPLINSNFIIGSNEIFTKPLLSLSAELSWDKLPDKFSAYYHQYNVYMVKSGSLEVKQGKKEIEKVESSKETVIMKLCKFIKCLGINKSEKAKLEVKQTAGSVSQTEKANTPSSSSGLYKDGCFKVNFQSLKNSSWIPLHLINKSHPQNSSSNTGNSTDQTNNKMSQALFNTPLNTPGQISKTLFESPDSKVLNSPFPCNPAIQNTVLKYTDTSSDGFIKMELVGPSSGFGSQLYPKVLSYYSLVNAYNISHSKDTNFEPISLCDTNSSSGATGTTQFVICPPPNIPFTPKLSSLTISYKASHTYTLRNDNKACEVKSQANEEIYPLQCYLYSVFSNYMVYDNTQSKSVYEKNYITSIASEKKITSGVPLYSSFNGQGALFIELENLLPTEELNIYFELKRVSVGNVAKDDLKYYYLSDTGWKKLDVIWDTTSKFTCSGILSVSVPKDISNVCTLMGSDQKFWFAFTVSEKPELLAQTLFLKTNGFIVERNGNSFLKNDQAPVLQANSISKPQNPIPEIATIIQPFDSFDGKGAENTIQKNKRVSNRIKTKDRAVSSEDYYRIIKQNFSNIYYSKSILSRHTKKVEVFLIQEYQNATEAGAFTPMVSKCQEEKIEKFLQARTSSFCHLEVSNFEFQKVEVSAVVTIKNGYEKVGMQKKINDYLNVFLSPWIRSSAKQVIIDQEITAPQISEYLQSIDGVDSVQCVGFSSPKPEKPVDKNSFLYSEMISTQNLDEEKIDPCAGLEQNIKPRSAKSLMVSSMNHKITCNAIK